MAYDKNVWNCGDEITAEKLNHMEDGIAEGGAGYDCTEVEASVINETITTEDEGGYGFGTLQSTEKVAEENVIIVFDGVRYECKNGTVGGNGAYGADFDGEELVFNVYPFRFTSNSDNELYTETAGTHTIEVITTTADVAVSECFKTAVEKVVEESGGGGCDNCNILNGSARASLRAISSATESDEYTIGAGAVALGAGTKASGDYSLACGAATEASGAQSHAEGTNTKAKEGMAHAEGNGTTASGMGSHAEGINTTASGMGSHAEGLNSKAEKPYAHAEGIAANASGDASHAEGRNATASGDTSHAEGQNTTASGAASHAEGERSSTGSNGYAAHAEGSGTTSNGYASHAEGSSSNATGQASHAEGTGTTANHKSQHVFGEYNIADPSTAAATARGTYIEIVGNGESYSKSNARTLDWSGNESLAGSLTLGLGTDDVTTITAAQLKALLALLN